jgi:hypothetical protein
MNVVLVVIPEPEPNTRSVLTRGDDPNRSLTPFFTGDGDVNSLCGGCGFTLCEKMANAAQTSLLVFQCPRCEAFNETRT